jgi:hypothetical protein
MSEQIESPEESTEKNVNVWLVSLGKNILSGRYTVMIRGERSRSDSIEPGDWLLVSDEEDSVESVGRIYRIRHSLDEFTFYFDKIHRFEMRVPLSTLSFGKNDGATIKRLQWSTFSDGIEKATGRSVSGIPLIEDETFVRELLQLAVIDDLLGPANGPHEEIIDMSVRDRYLVGKLAPMETVRGGIEGLEGPTSSEDEEEPAQMEVHTGRHEPGAEFQSTTGSVDPESDSSDEIDATNNQSLVPSSFGITFCVDGDVDSVSVHAQWGKYERIYDHEHTKTIKRKIKDHDGNVIRAEEQEVKVKVWQRIPCGGQVVIDMKVGTLSPQKIDGKAPKVKIQGTIREKNENGDRLVTLFLVNAQNEPAENKDSAWCFQPEIRVTATEGSEDKAIFRRRPISIDDGSDDERKSLEMIYRNQVEFAVGHGISVHAESSGEDVERAVEIRSEVLPQYEVPVTETPGLNPEDRQAMQDLVDKGYLDMDVLAEMEREKLVDALSNLVRDYDIWIKEQADRVGKEVKGYDVQANEALARCKDIKDRLQEGLNVLANDDNALTAFRLANRAMAFQRIHSLYALSRRRKEKKTLSDFNIRKNRSWRPFQLAFVLLSIPSLANLRHKDRTKPIEAFADLLWFPTGGGKTEAYLGVAAFTMIIRRFQGKIEGYDGSRGLAVIMRYTLRLLTLQQFQRGSTLLCALEVMRREALTKGDEILGTNPFTIGLWVGNKVTPGTTQDSHQAIEDFRNPDRWNPQSSPAQITSCPWCGSEVAAGRDIKVLRNEKRTIIYCGDKKGHCEFSEGKSSKQPHPGIPVLVVDEEIYHRPPSMMIATVDKFAMMSWRGAVRTLFGKASKECPRHGLLWPDADCNGNHPARDPLPAVKVKTILPIRPPDLIIQDEFHLISGPLGTLVGLYETAVDELCTWTHQGEMIRPKIIASTATVRKAKEQVNNVFMRRVSIFPPHGLNVEDNFFSVQRPISKRPGRRYMGICSPGSSRPAVLIRVYTALLTAASALFEKFGQAADPYMTTVGYFNSLRELGGMKRLAEDDVQTRAYRVQMSLVKRPGLSQRSISNIRELTSRVSNQDIPKYLDQLEVKFKAIYAPKEDKYVTQWDEGEVHAIDLVLATNMLSVGVDVNRLGLMAVNGQPKGTAEYIQSTSRVGRQFPGLVCTVLTWARPRDLSHYETFEHYHATFYKHVEAQSVTPFSPRAIDRGLTGVMLSFMRLENDGLNPNIGAKELKKTDCSETNLALDLMSKRAWDVTEQTTVKDLIVSEMKERIDEWVKEASKGGRTLAYEKKGKQKDTMVALIKSPGLKPWDNFTVPMSLREVEPGVRLMMSSKDISEGPSWQSKPKKESEEGADHV